MVNDRYLCCCNFGFNCTTWWDFNIKGGIAATSFALMVILTMIAANRFDTKGLFGMSKDILEPKVYEPKIRKKSSFIYLDFTLIIFRNFRLDCLWILYEKKVQKYHCCI